MTERKRKLLFFLRSLKETLQAWIQIFKTKIMKRRDLSNVLNATGAPADEVKLINELVTDIRIVENELNNIDNGLNGTGQNAPVTNDTNDANAMDQGGGRSYSNKHYHGNVVDLSTMASNQNKGNVTNGNTGGSDREAA